MPFPVNGSPSARFLTEYAQNLQTNFDRIPQFRDSLRFASLHYHASVANNRSVGCLVGFVPFYVKYKKERVDATSRCRLPTRSNPNSCKIKPLPPTVIGVLWRKRWILPYPINGTPRQDSLRNALKICTKFCSNP